MACFATVKTTFLIYSFSLVIALEPIISRIENALDPDIMDDVPCKRRDNAI